MIPIFIAAPRGRERRPPDRRRADQLRRPVEERVIRDARPHGRAGHAAQRGELRRQGRHGDPVQDDAVVPVDARGRDRAPGSAPVARAAPTRACGGTRRWRSRGGPAGGGSSSRAASAAVLLDRGGERRLRQRDDDFDEPGSRGAATGRAGVPRLRGAARASRELRAETRARRRRLDTVHASAGLRAPATLSRPRGCGGIGRRARFRSVWAKARGGSSPLIRISAVGSRFLDMCVTRVSALLRRTAMAVLP